MGVFLGTMRITTIFVAKAAFVYAQGACLCTLRPFYCQPHVTIVHPATVLARQLTTRLHTQTLSNSGSVLGHATDSTSTVQSERPPSSDRAASMAQPKLQENTR